MGNHAPFWGFWMFEPHKITGRHQNRQKTHPRVTTRYLRDIWSKSLGDNALFNPYMVKIRPEMRPGRSCENKV